MVAGISFQVFAVLYSFHQKANNSEKVLEQ